MMKKVIQGYIQVVPEEAKKIRDFLAGKYEVFPHYSTEFVNGVRFENGVCMTVKLDSESKEITAELYDGDTRIPMAEPMKLSEYFGEIMMQGYDRNLYQVQVVKEFEKGAANSWFKTDFNPAREMREVTVTAHPYATQYGTIQVPFDVTDVKQYVQNHFNEVQFASPELDYAGTDLDLEYEGQEEDLEKD